MKFPMPPILISTSTAVTMLMMITSSSWMKSLAITAQLPPTTVKKITTSPATRTTVSGSKLKMVARITPSEVICTAGPNGATLMPNQLKNCSLKRP